MIKFKLSVMMFIESFILGAWFVPIYQFLSKNGFTPTEITWSYACQAIAAIISPFFIGAIADRYFSAQKLLAFLMLVGGALLFLAAEQTEFIPFFSIFLIYSFTYTPTIALCNTLVFSNVKNVEKDYPPIRVLGTIGWICSGVVLGFIPSWLGFGDISATKIPLQASAIASILFAIFALTLPDTPPKAQNKAVSIKEAFGFNALVLFKDKNFNIVFLSSFIFSIAVAFYYTFANGFLTEVGMPNATGFMSLGQASEIFFMLALPFFIKKLGIKYVLLAGLITGSMRYFFFAFGDTSSVFNYALLFAGILIHGICYDLFFVTLFIYVDKKAPITVRTSAQGLVILCCQGVGSLVGYNLGGNIMEKLFAYSEPINNLTFNWSNMWLVGAFIILTTFFIFVFNFKEGKDIKEVDIKNI